MKGTIELQRAEMEKNDAALLAAIPTDFFCAKAIMELTRAHFPRAEKFSINTVRVRLTRMVRDGRLWNLGTVGAGKTIFYSKLPGMRSTDVPAQLIQKMTSESRPGDLSEVSRRWEDMRSSGPAIAMDRLQEVYGGGKLVVKQLPKFAAAHTHKGIY